MVRPKIHQETKGERTLKVWQNKCSLYGAVYENGKKVMGASFMFSDNDGTVYRVKEYFNF